MGGGLGMKFDGASVGVNCGGAWLVPASLLDLLLVTLLEIFRKRTSSCETKSKVNDSEAYKRSSGLGNRYSFVNPEK